jgi:hypothetical protein
MAGLHMGMDLYRRIRKRKYTVAEAVIVLVIYMAILIGYAMIMV